MKEIRNPFYSNAEVKRKLFDGLVVLATWKYGSQLWVKAAGAQRKVHRCVLCGKRTIKEDRLYRPLANPINRMHRACESCIDNLLHCELCGEKTILLRRTKLDGKTYQACEICWSELS